LRHAFASDIGQLQRIAHTPAAPSVDGQTWKGLLPDASFAHTLKASDEKKPRHC
jgi:hypothetical protein